MEGDLIKVSEPLDQFGVESKSRSEFALPPMRIHYSISFRREEEPAIILSSRERFLRNLQIPISENLVQYQRLFHDSPTTWVSLRTQSFP